MCKEVSDCFLFRATAPTKKMVCVPWPVLSPGTYPTGTPVLLDGCYRDVFRIAWD